MRVAYGLTPASDFDDISSDIEIQNLLRILYNNNISTVDAIIGALAEGKNKVKIKYKK